MTEKTTKCNGGHKAAPYAKIPHWVIEWRLYGRFTSRETRVIAYFERYALGYHKSALAATPGDVARESGLHVNHVRPTLRQLIERGVLITSEQGIGFPDEQPNWLPEATKTVATKSVARQPKRLQESNQNSCENATKTVAPTTPKAANIADSAEPKEKKESKKENSTLTDHDGNTVMGGGTGVVLSEEHLAQLRDVSKGLIFQNRPDELAKAVMAAFSEKMAEKARQDRGALVALEEFRRLPLGDRVDWYCEAMRVARSEKAEDPGVWVRFAAGVMVRAMTVTHEDMAETARRRRALAAQDRPRFQDKPWACLWRKGSGYVAAVHHSERDQLYYLACTVERFTGRRNFWHGVMDAFEAEGVDAAMAIVWEHWPAQMKPQQEKAAANG